MLHVMGHRLTTGVQQRHSCQSRMPLCARVQATSGPFMPTTPGAAPVPPFKADIVGRLLAAKKASGKTFTQIAEELGLTNVYTTQLFHRQQKLTVGSAEKLQRVVPGISKEDVEEMQTAPARRFDPGLIQDPIIYRLHEAIMHGGDSIKALINEECGDGIMSAIGFYATVDKVVGKEGEPRVVITFNGKFLPFIEQVAADNVAARPRSDE